LQCFQGTESQPNLALRHIGLARYIEAYRVYPQSRSDELARHAAYFLKQSEQAEPHLIGLQQVAYMDRLVAERQQSSE
jgi:hypothetical protein